MLFNDWDEIWMSRMVRTEPTPAPSKVRLKKAYTKTKGNREISVSMEYLRYKQQNREQLKSEEGYALSVRRMI
jgi:hypothetical protein